MDEIGDDSDETDDQTGIPMEDCIHSRDTVLEGERRGWLPVEGFESVDKGQDERVVEVE